jgi:ADP-heptose:LPS heptosyltransferase
MASLRKIVLFLLPGSLLRQSAFSFWKKFRAFRNRLYDRIVFPLWLVLQFLRYRKKLVILCRTGALGDVICALPMLVDIRKRHPGKPILFVTNIDYKCMLRLSPDVGGIYGARSWTWPFSLPENFNFLGLVEAVYSPYTTNERSKNGPRAHLMDDLAGSCGFVLSDPHPRLIVPSHLLQRVPVKYGFAEHVAKDRLIIGINCGQVWPVRMWAPAKWQALLDLIHAQYDAAILQFGFRKGDQDEYDNLRGVQTELRMFMDKDELVALVASCHLMITVDSGPTHISGAVGVPVVGLYGALKPDFFLPRFSPAVGVHSNVPCLFCNHTSPIGHWQSGCPHDIRCMKELEVQPVFQAVKTMLDKPEKKP